jgi:hypothetical protein
MAFRTWARTLLAALGVGALAGASQLGVAYGLGILRLSRVFDAAGRDQWTAQLAWAAWFAMVAGIVGALAGGHFHRRWAAVDSRARQAAVDSPARHDATGQAGGVRPARSPAWREDTSPDGETGGGADPVIATVWLRVAAAVAGGTGAAIVVPLTMQPARTAQLTETDPAVVIGLCAALGALVGVVAGFAALTHVVARWSLGTLIGATWLISVVSVLPSLDPRDPLPAVRLGVFDAGFLDPATTQRFALFTMPALGLLAGAGLGWAARRRGLRPVTIALTGLPGPALLTLAYLIAGSGEGGERYQVIPYWAAMVATGVGLLGAVIAAVIRHSTTVVAGDRPSVAPGENLLTPADELLDFIPPPVVPATAVPEARAPADPGPAARPPSRPPLAIGAGPAPTPADFTLADLAVPEPAQPDTFRRHVPVDGPPQDRPRAMPAPFAAIAPPASSPAPPVAASTPARRSRSRRAPAGDTGSAAPPLPLRPVAPQLTQPQQVSPPPANPTPVSPPLAAPQPIGPARHADPNEQRPGAPAAGTDGQAGDAGARSRRASRNSDGPPLGGKDAEFVDWVSGLGGD